MNISFEIPTEIERELQGTNGVDFGREAKEAYLVELYRQERITHHQLAEALGLSRHETDGVLKRHKVPSGPATLAELRAEVARLLLKQVEQARAGEVQEDDRLSVEARKPIWERIQELTADVPDEEWDQLPADLAEQHDHYLYGTPKRPTT